MEPLVLFGMVVGMGQGGGGGDLSVLTGDG